MFGLLTGTFSVLLADSRIGASSNPMPNIPLQQKSPPKIEQTVDVKHTETPTTTPVKEVEATPQDSLKAPQGDQAVVMDHDAAQSVAQIVNQTTLYKVLPTAQQIDMLDHLLNSFSDQLSGNAIPATAIRIQDKAASLDKDSPLTKDEQALVARLGKLQELTGEDIDKLDGIEKKLDKARLASVNTTSEVLTKKNVLSKDDRSLLSRLESTSSPISSDDIAKIARIEKKLEQALTVEVDSVTKKQRFFGGNKDFKSLIKTREELTSSLKNMKETLALNMPAKTDPRYEQKRAALRPMELKIELMEKQVSRINARLDEKFKKVGSVVKLQQYTSTRDAKHEELLAACARDPELRLKIAADPKTQNELMKKLAAQFADDPAMVKAMLKNQSTPHDAVHTLFEANQKRAETDDGKAMSKLLAAHKNTPAADLDKLYEGNKTNADVCLQLAGRTTNPETIKNMLKDWQDYGPVTQELARNEHTPQETRLALAAGKDKGVLTTLLANKRSDFDVIKKIIDTSTDPEVVATALKQVPKLSSLGKETLDKLRQNKDLAPKLAAEILGRTVDTSGYVDQAIPPGTKRMSSVGLLAAADKCDTQIKELQKLKELTNDDKALGGDVKGFQGQIELVEHWKGLLQEPLNKVRRSDATARVVTSIKQARDNLNIQSDRLQIKTVDHTARQVTDHLSTGSWIFSKLGEFTGDGGDFEKMSLVKTNARLNKIQGDIEQAPKQARMEIESLIALYKKTNGSGEAVEMLASLARDLDLKPEIAGKRLELIQGKYKGNAAILAQLVKDGKMSQSESQTLLTVMRNAEKTVAVYQKGMEAVAARKKDIDAGLELARAKGLDSDVWVAEETCKETRNRLEVRLYTALSSVNAIDPDYVASIGKEARSAIKDEIKPALEEAIKALEARGNDPDKPVSKEVVAYLRLQGKKLDCIHNKVEVAMLDDKAAALKKGLTQEDLRVLQGLPDQVDVAIASYHKVADDVGKRLQELDEKHTTVRQKVDFIKEQVKTAGSGGSESISLSISVRTPIPNLEVDARGGYTFIFQRNPETGMVDVIKRYEAGLGASFNATGLKAGGELFGGTQTKFSFKDEEEAGKFLQFLETGLPKTYKMPGSTSGSYGGLKALVQADLGKKLKLESEASLLRMSERSANGDEKVITQGQLAAKLEIETEIGDVHELELDGNLLDKAQQVAKDQFVDSMTRKGSTKPGLSLDARVTYQSKACYHNGLPTPDKDKKITEVEVALGAGLTLDQLNGVIAKLGLAADYGPTIAKKLGIMTDDTETRNANHEYKDRAIALLHGDKLAVNSILKLEWENGEIVGISVGAQVKTTTEKSVDLVAVKITGKIEKEFHRMHMFHVPQTPIGLERMETYFLADEKLCARTLASAGWKDTDVIAGKPLSEWQEEWTEKKKGLEELATLKTQFMDKFAGDEDKFIKILEKGKDHEILGKKLAEYVTTWKAELGDKAILSELKSLYMADHSYWNSNYRSAKADRGMSDSLVFSDKSVIGDRYLYEYEKQWAIEKAQHLEERQASNQVLA